MSDPNAGTYRFEYTAAARAQLREIRAIAKQTGKLAEFLAIVENAVEKMRTDPHGWGDPEYRSQHVDALYCHAIVRPVMFRYVIYEQVRGVVLHSVRLVGDFD